MSDIRTVHCDEEDYPALLRESARPPHKLYYRGSFDCLKSSRILGVVGTRRMSMIGRRSCERIVPALARAGYTIVSGFAYGIDTLAHQLTLESGGATIAVLANGLDEKSIYPQENLKLALQIIDAGGCICSEYPEGTTPRREYFPQRNRIVAGLSHGVLVIEAPEKSGALITAFRALHDNREVCAVPGPITQDTFQGCNRLLKLGAQVVTCAQDVFDVFGDSAPEMDEQSYDQRTLSTIEQRILDCLSREALHLDDLVERTKLDIRSVHSTLGSMELKGIIQTLGNGYSIKK